MKIAIALRGIQIQSGGAKEYLINLSKLLPQIDKNNEYFFYHSTDKTFLNLNLPNVTEKVVKKVPNLLWDQVLLPLNFKKDKIDVGLFLKNTIPLFSPSKSIVSILDLAYFFPGLKAYKFWDTKYMKIMMPLSIKKSNAVLAISKNSRADIYRMIGLEDLSKVKVTYLAAAYSFDQSKKVDIRKKYSMGDKPFIFLSSSLSPRKNIERAIVALGKIKDQIPHNFVITGGKSWGNNKVDILLKEYQLEDRFIKLGFVEDDDLSSLYGESDLYLHPSLYEGFSITLVEAMKAGCAIVASEVSSHPEVLGDAGLMFDPYDSTDMAEKILQVLKNPTLKKELIKKGYERAKLFTWEKCAKETLEVINNLNNESNKK